MTPSSEGTRRFPDGSYEVDENRFGFHWGPAVIERVAIDGRGGVVLLVATMAEGNENNRIYLRISPKGRKVQVLGNEA